MGGNNKFIDKFSNVAMRVGGQIHLKALRDTLATIMPLYILAGVAVLINNVVLPLILKGNALVNAQYWGTVITNGTLNISGLLVALISKFIQEPLRKVNTSLFGVIFLYSLGNFLFTLGIHQTVIFGYPIVYNMALMIPFVALPAIGIAIAYAATTGKFNRLEKWTKAGKIRYL